MVMKIENYEGDLETFNFPHNSKVFDDSTPMNNQQVNVPFANTHIFISSGSLDPKTLSIQGQFEGSSKDDDYAELLKKASSSKIKKFYFASDRFYLVKMPSVKKTQSGGSTNFLNYVATMVTPIPFIFSNTQKSDEYTKIGSVWTDGSKTNAGTHKTFIENIQVNLTGGSAGDTITIDDSDIGGITVTLPDYLNGEVLDIKLVSMVDSRGVSITEYWYVTIDDVVIQRSQSSGNFRLDITLEPDEQIDSLTISGTANYSTIDFFWRDAYLN